MDREEFVVLRTTKLWGICRKNRLHRLTFSRAVAQECLRHLDNSYEIRQFKGIVGKRISSGQTSPNGLYGIASVKTGKLLRVSMIKEQAEFYLDESRYLCEIWLKSL